VPAELCRLPGVGPSKACTLLAAIELGRRTATLPPGDRPSVASPAQAAALVQYEMSALDQEHLSVLLLNTRNRLVRIAKVHQGSPNTSRVRIGEVFREALRHNAAGLIVVHNHPSGDPSPSPVIWRKGVKGELGTSVDMAKLGRVFSPCQAPDRASLAWA
jgi:DNA repair protein RadC